MVGLVLQSLLVGILCLTSLYYTQSLPTPQLVTTLVAPPPLTAPATAAKPLSQVAKPAQTEAKLDHKESNTPMYKALTPTKLPERLPMEDKEAAPPPPVLADGVVGGIPGGVTGGKFGGTLGGIANLGAPAAAAASTPAHAQRVRTSDGLDGGLLVHKVMPSYPSSARQAHVSGSVVLQAIISKDGRIEDLRVVQGDPLLTSAAMDAVKQWLYKPYLLNGQPVEVETIITINFNSARG
jgi:protein TonB